MKKCPVFPQPSEASKFSLIKFLFTKNRSWLDVLTKKSYSKKMGKLQARDSQVFILNDVAEIRRILIKEPERFEKNEEYHEALESILGKSAFTTNDEQWQRQRKIVEPAFGNDLADFTFEQMDKAVSVMMQRFASFSQNEDVEADFQMRMVTSDIIYRTLFSDQLDEASLKTILSAFEKYQNASPVLSFLTVAKFNNNFIFKWLFNRRNKYSLKVREILDAKVEQRYIDYQAGGRQHDMLNAMFDSATKADNAFDLDEFCSQVAMLFLAGHETSATSFVWTLYLLATHHDEQEKVYSQIMLNHSDSVIKKQDLKRFKLLKNTFLEALRLYPPIALMSRQAKQDDNLRGKSITPKDGIIIAPWILHRHTDYWDKPNEFCPNRFTKGIPSERGSFLPFGMGSRMCIGMNFATNEGLLILSNIVSKYEITLAPGFEPEVSGKITLRSSNGLKLRLKPRI